LDGLVAAINQEYLAGLEDDEVDSEPKKRAVGKRSAKPKVRNAAK